MDTTRTNTSEPEFETVIGLEVHAQLRTASKAFSPDSAAFGGAPNTHVDPITVAHPGTLPVLNSLLVEHAIAMGLATQCTIAPTSIIARKHYFYPDLPKGYQISQYEKPICDHGWVDIEWTDRGPDGGDRIVEKRIGLTRIHIEEDAGKSVHDRDPYNTLIDVNRCGVPLIEIVSEPEISSPQEAVLYLKKVRQLVRYLGICDGNMEEGSFRCDANISIRPVGSTGLGTKTELKNMNSFRNVERALEHEIVRQKNVVRKGGSVTQETLLWDPLSEVTIPMRSKEDAHDYRYFPDPDLAPIRVDQALLDKISSRIPELPGARRQRYQTEWLLPEYDSLLLTEEKATADYFEAVVTAVNLRTAAKPASYTKLVSNIIMTEVLRVVNSSDGDWDAFTIEPERLAGLVVLRIEDQISSSGLQDLFNLMLVEPDDADVIAKKHNVLQVQDVTSLEPIVDKVLADNPDEVASYRAGKRQLIGFFVGQVMRSFPGAPDPKLVRALLQTKLLDE